MTGKEITDVRYDKTRNHSCDVRQGKKSQLRGKAREEITVVRCDRRRNHNCEVCHEKKSQL